MIEDISEVNIFHRKVVETNVIQKLEYRLKNVENESFWVQEYAKKIIDNYKTYYHCIIKDIDSDKKFKLNLISEKEQALHLANHLEKTREQERKNMAREIHDEIGHALTSLKLDMNLLIKKKFYARRNAYFAIKQYDEAYRRYNKNCSADFCTIATFYSRSFWFNCCIRMASKGISTTNNN